MISEDYFEMYKRMLEEDNSPLNQRMAHNELLDWYRENEAVYYRLIRKEEWEEKERLFMRRMEEVKTLLEL